MLPAPEALIRECETIFKVLCKMKVQMESRVSISLYLPCFLSSSETTSPITLSSTFSLSYLLLASFNFLLISSLSSILCDIL